MLPLDGLGSAEVVVRGGGLRQGLVDGGVELRHVRDLGPAGGRQDEDAGGVFEADALAQAEVCLDFGGEEAVGVHDEGHLLVVGLEPLAGEVVEVVFAGNRVLAREDVAAILFGCGGRDLVLEVTGVDGGLAAPEVLGEGEVMAEERNFIVFGGGVDDGEGVGAGGALEVFKLVDGGFIAGRELERRGVFEVVSGAWRERGLGLRLMGSSEGQGEQGCGGNGGKEGAAGHGSKTHKGFQGLF